MVLNNNSVVSLRKIDVLFRDYVSISSVVSINFWLILIVLPILHRSFLLVFNKMNKMNSLNEILGINTGKSTIKNIQMVIVKYLRAFAKKIHRIA